MRTNDLTEGKVTSKLLAFFFPLCAGNLFQKLYNAVDSVIVARCLGKTALAAVGGSSYLIITVLCNFFIALFNGGSVYIAQQFGSKDYKGLSDTVRSLFVFSFVCGAVLSVGGYILTPEILTWMKTTADSFDQSVIYLRISFLGTFFQLLYNMGAGVLRAVGDSKTPFRFLVATCILNTFLDILFVAVIGMEVDGAAYATVLSQCICCVMVMRKLFVEKDAPYYLSVRNLGVNTSSLKTILNYGLPMGGQSALYNITNVAIQVSVNTLGTTVVAAFAISRKIEGFFWGTMNAVNTTTTNFVGQNFGKKDYRRMYEGVNKMMRIFVLGTMVFGVFLVTCGKFIMPIFVGDDIEVVEQAAAILKFYGPLYWIWTINEVLIGACRGEGKTFVTMVISIVAICVIRLGWVAVVFGKYQTLTSLLLAYPVSWTVATVSIIIYYIYLRNKRMKNPERLA
ncbi:MAG: MATE family efflux transporter [Clostridia bacterium]|nr:MATE family efflux transporter [Clostridia bacterium]